MDRAEIQKKIALLKKDLDNKEKCLRHSQKKARRRSHVQNTLKEQLANASPKTSPNEPRKSTVTFKVEEKSTGKATVCCAVTPEDCSSDFTSQDISGRNVKSAHRKRLNLSPIEASSSSCGNEDPSVIGSRRKRAERRRSIESVDWSFLDEDDSFADMYSVVKRRRSTPRLSSVSTQDDTPDLVEPSPEISVPKIKRIEAKSKDPMRVEPVEISSEGTNSEESVSLLLHAAHLKFRLVDSPVVEFSLPEDDFRDLINAKSYSEEDRVQCTVPEKNLCDKESIRESIQSEEVILFCSSHEEVSSQHGNLFSEEVGCPKQSNAGLLYGEVNRSGNEYTGEITDDIVDELTGEVTDEIISELRDEIEEAIRNMLTVEFTDEIIDDIIEELADGITKEVVCDLKNEITDEITDGITDEFIGEILDEIIGELRDEIHEEITDEIIDEFTNEFIREIIDEILAEILEEITDEIIGKLKAEIIGDFMDEITDEITGEITEAPNQEVEDEEISASPEMLVTSDEEEAEDEIIPETKCEFLPFSSAFIFPGDISYSRSADCFYRISTLKYAQHLACLGAVMAVTTARRIFVYFDGHLKNSARISRLLPPDHGDEFIIEATHWIMKSGHCTLFITASNCSNFNIHFFSTDLKPIFSTHQIARGFGEIVPCVLALNTRVFLAVVDLLCSNSRLHQFTLNERSGTSTAIESEIKAVSSIDAISDIFLVSTEDYVRIWSTRCNHVLRTFSFVHSVFDVCLSVLDIKGYLLLPVLDAEGGKVIAMNPLNGRSTLACSLEIPSTWKTRNLRWKSSSLLCERYVCAVTDADNLAIWCLFSGKLCGVCADVKFLILSKDSLKFTSQSTVKIFNFRV